jgi:hypothetical protein
VNADGTTSTLKSVPLPTTEFAEGITIIGDKLLQITWKEKVMHEYTINSATSVTVTFPTTNPYTAANVGQSLRLSVIAGAAGIPGRYAIASVSGLTVTFTSLTTAVCTVTTDGALTFVTVGNCEIAADQAGNGTFAPAAQVAWNDAMHSRAASSQRCKATLHHPINLGIGKRRLNIHHRRHGMHHVAQ